MSPRIHVTDMQGRRHVSMREHERDTVVVIGAGLAGLTAAATAARAGKHVVAVEAHAGGGRARTDVRGGYRFNQGAHALVRGGPAWRILGELGVAHHGHQPPARGTGAIRDGERLSLLNGRTVKALTKILAASPTKWAGRSAAEWAESLGGGDLSDLARMFIRVSSYASDLEAMPADLAISQLKAGARGVSYLDGGWASLVSGLSSVASAAGATIRDHSSVAGVSSAPGGWEVTLGNDEVIGAAAVIVAAGGPAMTRKLLPVDPGWSELGPPVTAACLDLGLQGKRPPLTFGLNEPLYLSRHSPPGDLAPKRGSVVHLLRYGAREAGADRAELRRFAQLGGITDDQIVEERFLANMVVTHMLPHPEGGLRSRPAVNIPGAEGIFLAGDWVGAQGWLADAAMSSGQRAGMLAAKTAAAGPKLSQVA